MATPTTATVGGETSMDMVRIVEVQEISMNRLEMDGPETRMDRLGVEETGTRMDTDTASLEEVPTIATRTMPEEGDTARGPRGGVPGPERRGLEAGTLPTTGVERDLEPPDRAGTPPASNPS